MSPEKGRVYYSPMEQFFLSRLGLLLGHQRSSQDLAALAPWRRTLIGKAIYSTYRDLVDLGLATEAEEKLQSYIRPERKS
ncbi:hypothetical protein A3H85_02335 [Candidatus Daviesbacteria bacterium RIFCSPLOWO2_02_FULL_40_8]|uniref:Uncharacterized protein n=1 Tax=Candidatus Daviesbacteria bacterium RIFCSPLOWO2_01_FULL_40_24 TaxID=1797787 RepID=A0A1F5MIF6_9BACT|nr:MAG: hypothetical protein A2780_03220 [Candidatus Daviesbacteria bacterium RIFCSPHIGHO2_01_FULL_41_45]OGE34158.1 MAG: hypothetical protein A3C32_00305 [Candidatus Daviesbacteria bacterium RIFCSPHIGHO2_02_FULL_41_14]OGE65142.1 MAG: hypothetical protein A3B49_01255 [Candidatus Daviesbacteria bacterium RIFCSPLOWO2_01_FULL_40_24]OGE66908.1 MAG: hypothetical protein A3H85_02335 [Candidatus Daviesbacteria bacterium RIFCSPLOWO2_02_FULL_40_8]